MAPNPNSMAVAFRPITVVRNAMGWALSAERWAERWKAVGANGWMSIPGWVGELLMLRLVVTGTMEVNGG